MTEIDSSPRTPLACTRGSPHLRIRRDVDFVLCDSTGTPGGALDEGEGAELLGKAPRSFSKERADERELLLEAHLRALRRSLARDRRLAAARPEDGERAGGRGGGGDSERVDAHVVLVLELQAPHVRTLGEGAAQPKSLHKARAGLELANERTHGGMIGDRVSLSVMEMGTMRANRTIL